MSGSGAKEAARPSPLFAMTDALDEVEPTLRAEIRAMCPPRGDGGPGIAARVREIHERLGDTSEALAVADFAAVWMCRRREPKSDDVRAQGASLFELGRRIERRLELDIDPLVQLDRYWIFAYHGMLSADELALHLREVGPVVSADEDRRRLQETVARLTARGLKDSPALVEAFGVANLQLLHLANLRKPSSIGALTAYEVEQFVACADWKHDKTPTELMRGELGQHLEVCDLEDSTGAVRYQVWCFMVDSGRIFKHGTIETVGSFIQFGAQIEDDTLLALVRDAIRRACLPDDSRLLRLRF